MKLAHKTNKKLKESVMAWAYGSGLIALALFAAPVTKAANASCPGQNSVASQTLATINGNTTPSKGCEVTDTIFSNFTNNAGTATGGNALPTTSTLDMDTSAAGTVVTDTSVTGLTATYAPTINSSTTCGSGVLSGAGGCWLASGGDTTYSTAFDGTVNVDPSYAQLASPYNYVFSAVVLDLGTLVLTHSSNGTSTVTVTENFCLGGSATPATGATISGSANCSTADFGSIKITASSGAASTPTFADVCSLGGSSVACSGGADVSLEVLGAGRFTSLTTNTIVAIDDVHSSTDQNLDYLVEGFNDVGAPEPSSILLLGSALVGLGMLRFRKRRA